MGVIPEDKINFARKSERKFREMVMSFHILEETPGGNALGILE